MISVQEAQALIFDNLKTLPAEKKPLLEAVGLVLAEDITAPIDLPSFDQSAMDGYALKYEDLHLASLQTVREAPAGACDIEWKSGEAVKIFTGAMLPSGCDTVVMQEKVILQGSNLIIHDDQLKHGSNVRPKGSEIKRGQLALTSGTILNPGALGVLAGLGLTHVSVIPQPRIGIINTGNELIPPGQILPMGKIFESNSIVLKAALKAMNILEMTVSLVPDEMDHIQASIQALSLSCDIILMTGGVSVGKYDFVPAVCKDLDFSVVFHKVKQRPGKPFLYAKKSNVLLFGLPGNPGSVLTCFYQYVNPVIAHISGLKDPRKFRKATLIHERKKPLGLTQFFQGIYQDGYVTINDHQESYKLRSFAQANCIVVGPEATDMLEKGSEVEVFMIN